MTLIRTGFVVDSGNRTPAKVARLAPFYPLIPSDACAPCLDAGELFSVILDLFANIEVPRLGYLTLLGANRCWRDVLQEFALPGLATRLFVLLSRAAACLQLGRAVLAIIALASCRVPRWHRWLFVTLNPGTYSELLSLCHRTNRRYLAIAGYNTGVVHFGWKYPGRTVVRTIGTGRRIRVGENSITVDAGVLLKQAIQELAVRGKQFYVVPNYSYVSLGTIFMVPVHGSGSEVSTLGETIEQVLAYDPDQDRIVRLRRGEQEFGRCLYNPGSGLVVLRLRLRIRNACRYSVQRAKLSGPTAANIWQTFDDPSAANIELRKSRAASTVVDVCKYYPTADATSLALETPRDSIGRIWDRLEEHALTAWAFHTFVRCFGFHVELFLDRHEFEIFWSAHARLPIAKIQLRLLKGTLAGDSLVGDRDRISVDIFMNRRDSAAFLSFMKEQLPHARFNPGKHSM
ncbi:MAG: FAD-binding protein [Planctomycetes bacterium]|nr:FAD-binding protein [Planctomycetota bacterium]